MYPVADRGRENGIRSWNAALIYQRIWSAGLPVDFLSRTWIQPRTETLKIVFFLQIAVCNCRTIVLNRSRAHPKVPNSNNGGRSFYSLGPLPDAQGGGALVRLGIL